MTFEILGCGLFALETHIFVGAVLMIAWGAVDLTLLLLRDVPASGPEVTEMLNTVREELA